MDRITENLEYAKNQATEAWNRNMHGNSGQGSSLMNNNSSSSNQSYMDQARGKANDMLNRAGDMMGKTQDSAKDRMSEMEPKADE
ncbi:hypothetical protein BO82DRAFT_400532 [Aspergillus uvarum CBS 121591]|uniref:Uncharacterized protein n=1 Tax=Aspergillus uvarum CBS 121591 TaxID=1448315 RepID=A0A319CWY7_9EURO|nr:hypothetical protein BO82DRAFT_400532 [Aspergillus uvarum CBS 121591]PYH83453.1 hypothetical protein BO82DRAFT_400532 [Aspergillus uvarum CBS 121591]